MNKIDFFLSNTDAFLSFALLHTISRMLNKSSWSEYDDLVTDTHRKAFSHSSLSVMLTMYFREFVHFI